MASTRRERAIARKLGVSTAGLDLLLKLNGGEKRSGGMAAEPLARSGFITATEPPDYPVITELGRAVVKRARALGY